MSKVVNKAIKAELKEALSMSGVPSWVIDRVHEFTAGLYPFVKGTSHGKGPFTANGGSPTTPPYVIDPPKETSEELSQQFQDFYAELEEEMRTIKSPVTARPRTSTFSDAEAEKEKEKGSVRHSQEDDRAKEILEAVERVVSSLFYDRCGIFSVTSLPRLTSTDFAAGYTYNRPRMMPLMTKPSLAASLHSTSLILA